MPPTSGYGLKTQASYSPTIRALSSDITGLRTQVSVNKATVKENLFLYLSIQMSARARLITIALLRLCSAHKSPRAICHNTWMDDVLSREPSMGDAPNYTCHPEGRLHYSHVALRVGYICSQLSRIVPSSQESFTPLIHSTSSYGRYLHTHKYIFFTHLFFLLYSRNVQFCGELC